METANDTSRFCKNCKFFKTSRFQESFEGDCFLPKNISILGNKTTFDYSTCDSHKFIYEEN